MHNLGSTDPGRAIDWGKTSDDYSGWRPDYPPEFYIRLSALGVGRPGQHILDLGTGVGFLAANFAKQGCKVSGVDVSPEQILEARRRAASAEVSVDFRVAPAEDTGFEAASFDAITASQSWLYFDRARAIAEVKRLLRPEGFLATAHFCWLPRLDPIAKASEALVLKHNPVWSAADFDGNIPAMPRWAAEDFRLVGMFVFDAQMPFTHESWRGRIRACRGVGAALDANAVADFDREHADLLRRIAPQHFTVLHRIDCHIFQPLA